MRLDLANGAPLMFSDRPDPVVPADDPREKQGSAANSVSPIAACAEAIYRDTSSIPQGSLSLGRGADCSGCQGSCN